jgi:hypothetical protein
LAVTWREPRTRPAKMCRSAALLALVVGCTANVNTRPVDPPAEPELPPGSLGPTAETTGQGWTYVGYGVEYQRVNTGNAILIAYGGYSAHLSYSAGWATELVDAKLGALNVGQIYAVQGPQDPGYQAREIGNSKIRHHLPTIDDGQSPIYVVAHSSGSYVAHELLSQLYNAGSTDLLARISYADLDGGGSGLTTDIVDDLRTMTFVYADDPTLSSGHSENYETAIANGEYFSPKATSFEVTVPSTGCHDGAGWCLHDVLITHQPHNHSMYDLADDYTDFVGRPPTIEYIDAMAPTM